MGQFHAGELGVQRQRGVRRAAERVGRIVESEIPPRLGPILGRHRMAVAASLDARRRPWASLLAGSPGFVQVVDEHLLRVVVDPTMDELLVANLAAHADVGLLVIDPETRERWRVNGRGQLRPEGLFILVDQVYGNCPKYIHRRRVAATSSSGAGRPTHAESLDRRQRALVAEADTFFIATWHPEGGADASHRGGPPGFVTLLDDRTLEFPDYPGNNLFNTLGNLADHPHAGLLFTDFATGDALQLTGHAWLSGPSSLAVRIAIEEVRATPGGSGLWVESVDAVTARPLPVTGGRSEHPKDETGEEPAKEEGEMGKHIACGDVVSGCQFTAQAGTEQELLEAVKAHAAKDHGVKEVTPELAAKVKAAIQTR